MTFLIDAYVQQALANRIDAAVEEVLNELPNHGSEEGITPVLGHALRRQSVRGDGFQVRFNYRQLNKNTEEPSAGADGGFLVTVQTPDASVSKTALFQAKLLRGHEPVRELRMSTAEAARLQEQATNMLTHTGESVAIFYTRKQIYVVDAASFQSIRTRTPLAEKHRLITLGTYLGKWLPRCTKGDKSQDLFKRVTHLDGFKRGLTMEVISERPSIAATPEPAEVLWGARPIMHRRKQ
ncbi:hypothetical protein [uncultured Aquabacterium sp.]|uniref:hypothetical protein n=1 Tax=uncultured Aquabacterium sp. TaxID=158753 RepID=UPI00262ED87F|nr:hypothetical protein [uncultured Aquabacterium sp.]